MVDFDNIWLEDKLGSEYRFWAWMGISLIGYNFMIYGWVVFF